jgi:hypothetical protein
LRRVLQRADEKPVREPRRKNLASIPVCVI